jgi:hypothetical protein
MFSVYTYCTFVHYFTLCCKMAVFCPTEKSICYSFSHVYKLCTHGYDIYAFTVHIVVTCDLWFYTPSRFGKIYYIKKVLPRVSFLYSFKENFDVAQRQPDRPANWELGSNRLKLCISKEQFLFPCRGSNLDSLYKSEEVGTNTLKLINTVKAPNIWYSNRANALREGYPNDIVQR